MRAKPIKRPGRPKTNPLPRAEQLRLAKKAQRQRDRDAELVLCQIKLPKTPAKLLRQAVAVPGFDRALEQFLRDAVVDANQYPNLHLLCWNRATPFLTDRDAFGLYERNWRFVDDQNMGEKEKALVRRLTATYGAGVLNV